MGVLYDLLTRGSRRHKAIIDEFERTNRSLARISDKLREIHSNKMSLDDIIEAEEERNKLSAKLSEMLITANQIQQIYNDLVRRSHANGS